VRGLYPIVDVDALSARGFDPIEFAECVLLARPPLLQLRSKSASARETLALLRALLPLCRRAGSRLYANDRPDLALLAGADGVHLGQDDLPPEAARQFAPGLDIGLSTHDLGQLERALDSNPTYVAFGPVFATRSKQNPDRVVSPDGLARAAELTRARGVPLVAIGGIDLERAPEVARHADLGAVIAALVAPELEQVTPLAAELNAIFGGR
jgi:thiamine-phosphate pyrophosphorylase